MSRLIVKNIPGKVTAEKLKELFSEKGEVTDVQLKYTRDGTFRGFGFVGFRTEPQAEAARQHFHHTCLRSAKISVELCAALGDEKKPRAWSKYAADSTAYQNINKVPEDSVVKKKEKKKKKDKIKELLEKHKDDPMFAEFMEAHVNEKTSWIKAALEEMVRDKDNSGDDDVAHRGSNDHGPGDDGSAEGDTAAIEKLTKEEKEHETKPSNVGKKVADKEISDLEYMKAVMKKKVDTDSAPEVPKAEEKPKKIRNRPLYHVKITGLPYKCKKRDMKEFFRPLVPYSIRFPLGKGKKLAGFCFVGFRTENELNKALNKDKLFLAGHRVHVQRHEDTSRQQADEQEQNDKKKKQQNEQNEESIGESGRIFVRNLPYIVTEDEITKLFEKYGPLSEVSMPVDGVLRQAKGFATVTFLLPEHAARAYSELDGTVFSGRMLHLLPGKPARDAADDDEGLSFKEKKAKKLKAQAKSSHNWNTLFLGANAVADVVADAYSTTKEHLLTDNTKKTSAAVRLALGETQLVAETRNFLEENGVFLDAFSQVPKKRSKTCILLKNLPAQTTKDEIRVLFEKHGKIARFVMPKHGITALIDFVEPSEARKAFSKLAYSQFKTSPLYLEWAPDNAFTNTVTQAEVEHPEENNNAGEEKKHTESNSAQETRDIVKNESERKEVYGGESIVEGDPEADTTLFVKNLNFRTNDEDLRMHFTSCGKIHSATIAKKKDPKNPGQVLSMGYGFVQFYEKKHTNDALKSLQHSTLDGKTLELKRSERGNTGEVKTSKKTAKAKEQNGTKILVRNIPFQANRNELHEIFRAFGEIKTLRLPKKLTPGSEQHRGFCFVDFYSKADAKSAFDALSHSTHLYGRRMVLEWADSSEDTEDVSSLRKRTADAYLAAAPGGKKANKSVVDVDMFVTVKE